MRIAGRRADGAKLVLIGGGLAVVLRGTQKSRPLALRRTDALGPWAEADNSLASRRVVDKQLAQARVSLALDAPVPVLNLVGPGKHSAKWHRCWEDVQAKGHDEQSAAAICTAQLGDESYDASIAEEVPNAIALDNPGGTNQYGGPYRGAGSDSAKSAGKASWEALRHAVGPVHAIEQARKDAQAAQEGWAGPEHHDRLADFHEGQSLKVNSSEAADRHAAVAGAHRDVANVKRSASYTDEQRASDAAFYDKHEGYRKDRRDADIADYAKPKDMDEARAMAKNVVRGYQEVGRRIAEKGGIAEVGRQAEARLSPETKADIKAGLKNWKDSPALPKYKPNPADMPRGSTVPIRERKASDYAGAPVTKSQGMTPIRERRSRDVMAEVRTSVLGPLGQYGAATRKRSKGED